MIEQLYLYLILIGVTIGVVLRYLSREASSVSHVNLGLIRLNEQHNFDLPNFLRASWPLLSEAGLRGAAWRLDWFGVIVEEHVGQARGKRLHKELAVGEMKLAISLYRTNKRGERRYFDEAVMETLLLLLRTDMWIKAGATDITITQMAKLSLFLQHDMKNIAQFIQLMADQLANIPPGKEQQVLDYLRVAVPMIRERADRVVGTLTDQERRSPAPARRLELREELGKLCQLHQLGCTIVGDAQASAPDNALQSALDNILKNYGDHAARAHLDIAVQDGAHDIDILIEAADAPATEHIERLFEPFWSSDPNGLGIGLYQAKQGLERCGGALDARRNDAGVVQFRVRYPHAPRVDA